MLQAAKILQEIPELAVFACLALGYALGSLKYRGFGLGTVVGTLTIALVVGQAEITIAPFSKTLFFALFMFAVGYEVGPEFFRGIRRGGAQMVAMSLTFCALGLGSVVLMSKLFGFDKGLAAGLLSGALTQSAAIGTSTDAIQRLPLAPHVRELLVSHIAIGDAVTYVFGTAGVLLFLTKGVPALLRFDLRAESQKYEEALGAGAGDSSKGVFDSYVAVDVQAFRLVEPELQARTVAEAEKVLSTERARLYVQRLRRGRRLFSPEKSERLQPGDVLAISGSRERLLEVQPRLGPQVVDLEVLDIPLETTSIVVTQKSVAGKTLLELARSVDPRGVHLRRILRQGQQLPRLPNSLIERGDLLEVTGRNDDIDRIGALIGFVDRPRENSDVTFLGLAAAAGSLLGLLSIKIANIPVSLGTGGGVLMTGLVFGWLHSIRPQWGRIPAPAVWLMQTLGLNTFVAIVGLSAAPHVVEAMKTSGLQLLVAGIVVSLVPHLMTALLGRHFLGLNGGILVGACAGAGTCTPALSAAVEEAESRVPALGYTIPYAISNVLLTAWGPLIVSLM
jgi:putative transport protein